MRSHRARRVVATLTAAVGALLLTPIAASAAPQEVDVEGRVSVVVGEDPSRSQVKYLLRQDERLYELELEPAQARSLEPDDLIAVRGTRDGDTIAVDDLDVEAKSESGDREIAGTRSVLILRVFWNTQDAVTPAVAVNQVGAVDDNFYRENSYGQLRLTAQATQWLQIEKPADCDELATINNRTQDAAATAGIDTAPFHHNMIYISSRDCVGRNWGQIGGRVTWIQGTMNTYRTAHELGHNFGLGHAHSKSCTDASGARVPMSANCTSDEYGDRFNVMGYVPPGSTENAPTHLSAPQKNAMGWLGGRSLTTDTGTHTLAPLADQSASLHAIKLNTTGQQFWLEYRQPVGVDAPLGGFPGITNGVVVHETEPTTGSWLLDMTAPSASGFNDAALPVGGTWTDPTGRVTVRVNSVGPAGASVTLASRLRTVPFVRELGASAAARLVTQAGLVPRFTGATSGSAWVWRQSPAAGSRVEPGSIVTMQLRTGPIP